ncbi:phage tail protein [Formicincola oecophyllae]|uniref:Phage tail protein n=2 Tax=Formicincola oecophyllae TaxID=2558361 RepID=A0A4Y6U9C4_9PROT|nr:phage tail protein [Formicincola oecophyllae]
MIYKTQQSQLLDEILWMVFGSSSDAMLASVYNANPGLADYGPILPGGLAITLPDGLGAAPPATNQAVRLWD